MTWIVHIHDGAAKQLKWTTSACSKRTLFLTLVMIQKILIDRLAPREAFGRAIQDLMRCARRAATLREIKALPPASGNATSDPYAIKPCSLRRHASHCPASAGRCRCCRHER